MPSGEASDSESSEDEVIVKATATTSTRGEEFNEQPTRIRNSDDVVNTFKVLDSAPQDFRSYMKSKGADEEEVSDQERPTMAWNGPDEEFEITIAWLDGRKEPFS